MCSYVSYKLVSLYWQHDKIQWYHCSFIIITQCWYFNNSTVCFYIYCYKPFGTFYSLPKIVGVCAKKIVGVKEFVCKNMMLHNTGYGMYQNLCTQDVTVCVKDVYASKTLYKRWCYSTCLYVSKLCMQDIIQYMSITLYTRFYSLYIQRPCTLLDVKTVLKSIR